MDGKKMNTITHAEVLALMESASKNAWMFKKYKLGFSLDLKLVGIGNGESVCTSKCFEFIMLCP